MSSSAPASEVSKGLSTSFSQISAVRPKLIPSRSIAEVSPPSAPKVHRHHHHPHLHRPSKESKEPQSAGANLQPSISNTADLGGSSNDGSQDVSRRGSMFWEEPRREVTESELEEERERGELRASEIRNSVLELNTISNTTTRRLDNTYYAVLEKLSVLQSTITSLKELAGMTRTLNQDFKAESEEDVKDITTQLSGFEQVSEQEHRIQALQSRVAKGRSKISDLGKRVDVVKDRVEGWGTAELEWQEKLRQRLNIMWTAMGCMAAVFIAMRLFQYTQAPESSISPRGLNATGLLGKIPDMEPLKNESTWMLEKKIEQTIKGKTNAELEQSSEEDDPRLRIFDEL